MSINEKESLSNLNIFLENQFAGIVTKEDILRIWDNYFKIIGKLLDKSEIKNDEFEIGKRKVVIDVDEVLCFYKNQYLGLTSTEWTFDFKRYKLENIIDDLYPPKQIRHNLILLLNRSSRKNQKKINELNTELGFVKDLFIYKK